MIMPRTNVDALLGAHARLDGGEGPALRLQGGETELIVQGAMQRCAVVPAGGQRQNPQEPTALGRVLPFRRRGGALIGLGLIAATTAAAALGTGVARRWLARQDAGSHAPPQASAVVALTPAPLPVRSRGPERGTPEIAASSPTISPALASGDQSPSPTRRSWRLLPSAPPRVQDERAASPEASSSAPVAAFAPKPAVDLLAQANALRGQQEYRQALHTYLEVVRRYPHTRQAEAARVAAAALRLEHLSDPAGAARQYRTAGSPQGLEEETAFGLAEAHRAAGRADRERAQLQYFLKTYPRSPLAPAARQRLGELADEGQ